MFALDQARALADRVKARTAQIIAGQMIQFVVAVGKKSDSDFIRLTSLFEKVARSQHHKKQLGQLRELIEQRHPVVELGRKIFDLHPNYRRRVIQNLAIRATWLGEHERVQFALREGVYPPYLIVISPIVRCNLHCVGCYAGQYPRVKDPLSNEVLDRIITEGKEMGTYFFTISGGEPFLREDLLDLYERHKDATFQIYTNGTCISDEAIERMQRCGNVAPALSLEGFEEQTDARRGKGVYAKVMETMDRLRDAGIMFGFSATATRLNADIFLQEEFYDEMIEKGCLFGWFFIFVPVGQDSDMALMTTPEQRDKLRAMNMHIRRTKPIFVADFWSDGCLTDGCMAGGRLYLHINYRGDVEPCVFIHFATHNILDIHEKGGHLRDVLKTPFFKGVRKVNREDPNRLRPCIIIDHNEKLAQVVKEHNARPTHEGAEAVVTRLSPELKKWAEEYAILAEKAWQSPEYEWARNYSGGIRKEVIPEDALVDAGLDQVGEKAE